MVKGGDSMTTLLLCCCTVWSGALIALLGVNDAGKQPSVGEVEQKPQVTLTLESASAQRWTKDILFKCKVTLANDTGKELKVKSNFLSVFDGMTLVIQDEKGKELKRQGYTYHQSPFALNKEHRLQSGKTTDTINFPISGLAKDHKKFRIKIVGTLPGSEFKGRLTSKVIEVRPEAK
jgi:hypothetical protein